MNNNCYYFKPPLRRQKCIRILNPEYEEDLSLMIANAIKEEEDKIKEHQKIKTLEEERKQKCIYVNEMNK